MPGPGCCPACSDSSAVIPGLQKPLSTAGKRECWPLSSGADLTSLSVILLALFLPRLAQVQQGWYKAGLRVEQTPLQFRAPAFVLR